MFGVMGFASKKAVKQILADLLLNGEDKKKGEDFVVH